MLLRTFFGLSLLTFFCSCNNSDTPQPVNTFLGASKAGGTFWDQANGLAVDAMGNIYVTGIFRRTAFFGKDTQPTAITSTGSYDVFVARYTPQLDLIWVTKAGGTGFDQGIGIDVDASGNTYVTGSFSGIAAFGNDTLRTGGSDYFVMKLDPNGRIVWSRPGGTSGVGISVKATGSSVVVAADYQGSAHLAGNLLTSRGRGDIFVTKYDANSGVIRWATSAGSTYDDSVGGIGIDAFGNIYVTGLFFGEMRWDSTTVFATRLQQGFLSKLDQGGRVLWMQSLGGAEYPTSSSLAVDPSGNCYLAGNFTESITLGGTTLNTTGQADLYVAKFQPSGNVVWVRNAGGSLGASSIAIDRQGSCYVTGPFLGTAFYSIYAITASNNDADVFVAKYNNAGTLQWTRPGGFNAYYRDCVVVDNAGAVTVAGSFSGSATIGSQTMVSASTDKDVFLWRMSAN